MNFFQLYAKEIVSLVVPFLAWALSRFFKAKAKLILANPHTFTFIVQEPQLDPEGKILKPNQNVRTVSYLLKNVGSEPAKKIEFVFNWKPLCINIWPARHTNESIEPDKRFVVFLESLAPDEFVGLELLSVNEELPNLVTVRSEQCVAKYVEMYPQQIIKPWLGRVAATLMVFGAGASIYLFLLLLQYLILATPFGR